MKFFAVIALLCFQAKRLVGDEECIKGFAKDYSGKISTTASGKVCKKWDDVLKAFVHLGDNDHEIKDENFPERSVKDAENYCRSPGSTHSGDSPWCFIIDNFEGVIERLKKGEKVEEKDILDHCDIQFCKDQSFGYPCKSGYCSIGYSGQILGTFEDLAEACTTDHPKCKAFFYSSNKGYGTLCDTSDIDGQLTDHKTCVKSPVPSCSSGFVGSDLQECNGCVINIGKDAEYHCIEYAELEKMARRYGITGAVDKQFCIKHGGIDCSDAVSKCPKGFKFLQGGSSGLESYLASNPKYKPNELEECGNGCNKRHRCKSFKWSADEKRCVYSGLQKIDGEQVKDYRFCLKD